MDAIVPFLLIVGFFAASLGCCVWLAVHVRRRGTAGGAISAAMASYDEAFKVTSHESYYEIQALTQRKAPLLSPDEEWRTERGAAGRLGSRDRPLAVRPRRLRRGLGRRIARLGRRGR
ncbi:hypothetical protein [Streptomyces zagrosensis]|uniref:Secreted protein n=1 Tax=Streptomyces zagrosensis TaxID=1042984 RepID=A0A7W9Q6Q7_9ACTN|nr:hypothetical protein [Streptomyces zagrosensis]MBB5934389.1 hypothetical protein [Streptomyces zagrosensis]